MTQTTAPSRTSADHLDAATIAQLAAGGLSSAELERVRRHIPTCEACRDRIRAHAHPQTQVFMLTRKVPRRWPKVLAVLISLGALSGSAWWSLHDGGPSTPAANVAVVQSLSPIGSALAGAPGAAKAGLGSNTAALDAGVAVPERRPLSSSIDGDAGVSAPNSRDAGVGAAREVDAGVP